MQTDTDLETSPPAPSRWDDFRHRLGEKKGALLQRKIENRESLIAESEKQHEQALAKLRTEREAALSVADRLNSLQLEVERVSDELALAESVRGNYKSQLSELEALFLNAWGDPAVYENFGGPNYREVAVLRVAIEDYPRVRDFLMVKLARAQAALAEFERQL